MIHPYDAVETIAGQGTVALEWEEDLERLGLEKLDTVLVAVGGGGLVAGVAAWFQGRVKVVGVEPEGSRALYAALEADKPVDVTVNSLAADLLGAKRVGELDFDIAKSFVSGVVLVEDASIAEAQRGLWAGHSIIADPGGAAAFAAITSGPIGRGLTSGSVFWSAAPMPILIPSCPATLVETLSLERKIRVQPLRRGTPRTMVRPLSAGPTSRAARWGVAKW